MECRSCGAELDYREAFCSKCGEVTDRGKGASGLAGRYAAETFNGLGQLIASVIDYLTNPANRTKVSIAAGVAVFSLVSLTSNPISRSAGELFSSTPDAPTFNDDGTPNFAEYADIFIGEEVEYFVTGSANIRDFPTSQGTEIIGALSEGETTLAREVMSFDSDSRWLRLASGGYVWGENLIKIGRSDTGEESPTSSENSFAENIRGTWSNMASCTGREPDTPLVISEATIRLGDTPGDLQRVTRDELGREEYHIGFSDNDHGSTVIWRMSRNANGFSILIDDVEYPESPMQEFHTPSAGCRPEFMIE